MVLTNAVIVVHEQTRSHTKTDLQHVRASYSHCAVIGRWAGRSENQVSRYKLEVALGTISSALLAVHDHIHRSN